MPLRRTARKIDGLAFFAACTIFAATISYADTIIRTESRVVLVEAIAVDKKGNFARDLSASDFKIWQDGKEQKITSFSLESAGISPDRSGKHYIVLYFDTTTGMQLNVRQEAARFVEGFASPDRYMSVLTFNSGFGMRIGQNFTNDKALIEKAVGAISNPAVQAGNADMLLSLRNVAKSLGTIRGRKALVLFGAGAPEDSANPEEVADTIAALNKANVAVYSAGAQNKPTRSAPPVTTGRGRELGNAGPSRTNYDMEVAIAPEENGTTVEPANTDLAESLGKVAQEQDEYYLLGYTPAVESAEGSCHVLNVRTDRSNFDIRARKSYCTSNPVNSLSGKPAGQMLETRVASGAAGNLSARMQLPWFYSGPNVASVDVAMDIVLSAMKFQKEKGKLHGELELAGVAYKPDGTAAARFSDAVPFEFDTKQQADVFLKKPYHYTNEFKIAPGQYNVRVAFSSGDRSFGKVEMPLAIEPLNPQSIGISGVALSRDVHRAGRFDGGSG